MKRLIISFLLISSSLLSQGNYNKLFKIAIQDIEKNYAGFHHKTMQKPSYYAYLKSNLLKDSLNSQKELWNQLQKHISFFEDNHLYLFKKEMEKHYSTHNYFKDSFKFDILKENTCYLKIPHFVYKPYVDSLVENSINTILSKRKLIIDIRGNEGGGDHAFKELLPIIATNDIYVRSVDFLATKENWEFLKSVNVALGDWDSTYNGKFISAPWIGSNDYFFKIYEVEYGINEFPKKIAVLTDGYISSSGEQFVFCAKQSLKVKVFGDNTKGTIDYSNCRHFELIKDSIYISVPTTKIKGIPKNGIDQHGIAPDFYLHPENQIEQILNYFNYWD